MIIVTVNLDEVKQKHAEFIEALQKLTSDNLTQYGKDVRKEVAATTAFKGKRLRRDVKVTKLNKTTLQVNTTLKHALYMEKGTKPHVIRARRARYLKFVNNQGMLTFRKSVNHPGNQPTNYFSKANDKAWLAFCQAMDDKLRELTSNF